MLTLLHDVRYALRQLRKTPAFTATVVLTLALGIGANAAIFTLADALFIKTLPVAGPRSLVRIGDNNDCCVNSEVKDSGDYALFSTDTYEQFKRNSPEFEELAAMQAGFAQRPIIARRDLTAETPRSVMGEFVSGNYFRTFGLKPQAGRFFVDTDDAKGAPVAAVMSYDIWKNSFAGDPSIVGGTLWVNTKRVTVVGIAPRQFFGDRISSTPPDLYLPIHALPLLTNTTYIDNPDISWLYVVGRLRTGVNWSPLQQKLSAILRESLGSTNTFATGRGKLFLPRAHVTLAPGGTGIQSLQEEYALNLLLLTCMSILVLLVACANIANLLLVRGMGRGSELSVRAALGAPRLRLVRQLFTESVLLAGLGGLVSLFVAYMGVQALLSMAFPHSPNIPIHALPSIAVVGFSLALSLVTGILFGVVPAWMTTPTNPAAAMRASARTTTAGATMVQRGLVVLQAALSLILLVGAGLFSQSLNNLKKSDLKIDTANRFIVHINPQAAGYTEPQLEALYRSIEQRFHGLPHVLKVGIATNTPMEDNNWGNDVQIQGQVPQNVEASMVKANTEYFDSVGTRLPAGRGIDPKDTYYAPTVAVVNRSFAQTFFGKNNPIGHRFGPPESRTGRTYQIVGVAEDSVYTDVRWRNHLMYFVPLTQPNLHFDQPIERDTSLYAGALVIQTDRPVHDMESLTSRTLASINPNLSIVKFQTFEEQIADRFSAERLVARLMVLFSALSLLLASVGLYGVTAYGVARRAPEIGIRMALGAQRSGVIAMIMRGAMLQVSIGLVVGIPMSLLGTQLVRSRLYEITSLDFRVMAFAVVILGLSGVFAGIAPALRAASIDPIQSLRAE